MRIAFILPSLVSQGPIVVAHTIINHMIPWVDKIDVFYFDEITGLDFPCDVHRIDYNIPIDFDSYDIIHTHMYRPDKYVFKWRKKIKKARTVTTIHQDIFQNLRYSYNWGVAAVYTPLWLRYMKVFDRVCPISNKLWEMYKSRLSNLNHTVYNGVDVDYEPALAEAPVVNRILELKKNNCRVIGTYAYITRRKGIDLLLELCMYRDDVVVVIIGEGKEKSKLEAFVRVNHLGNRVLFLPYLPKPYNYLGAVDIYAMPSRSEGFGLALVEGACTKTPIVCSDIEVFHEVFDASAVSFFELDNVVALSDAIDDCWMKRESKVENAFRRAKCDFSGYNMAQEYLNVYKELL